MWFISSRDKMAKLHSRLCHLLLVGLLFTPCLHVSGELASCVCGGGSARALGGVLLVACGL